MKWEKEWGKEREKKKLHAYKQDISATLIFKSLHLRFYWPIHCWLHSNIKRGEEETDNDGVRERETCAQKLKARKTCKLVEKKYEQARQKGKAQLMALGIP